MNEGEVLKRLLKKDYRSTTEIATLMKVARDTLYRLQKMDEIPITYKERFAEIGIVIAEQQKNVDEHNQYMKKNPNIVFKNHEVDKLKDIPFYNVEAIGGRIDMIKDTPEYITGYYRIPGANDADAIIRVAGHSMYPDYPDGSMIAIKHIKNLNIIHPGVAHVIVTEEQTFIKLLIKNGADSWILRSINKDPRFADFEVKKSDIIKLYIVKAVINQSEI